MKRLACLLGTALTLVVAPALQAQEEEKQSPVLNRLFNISPSNGPKWTAEEQQLQSFWRDYYRSLAAYYASLDKVDWVAYYKKHGYPIDPRFYNPHGIVPDGSLPVPVPVHPSAMQPMPGMMPQMMPQGMPQVMPAGYYPAPGTVPAAAMPVIVPTGR